VRKATNNKRKVLRKNNKSGANLRQTKQGETNEEMEKNKNRGGEREGKRIRRVSAQVLHRPKRENTAREWAVGTKHRGKSGARERSP